MEHHTRPLAGTHPLVPFPCESPSTLPWEEGRDRCLPHPPSLSLHTIALTHVPERHRLGAAVGARLEHPRMLRVGAGVPNRHDRALACLGRLCAECTPRPEGQRERPVGLGGWVLDEDEWGSQDAAGERRLDAHRSWYVDDVHDYLTSSLVLISPPRASC